jgi:ribonuclease R
MGTTNLEKIAELAMLERNLDPEYAEDALAQVRATTEPAFDDEVVDLRHLPWCSIDNGEGELVTSKDLDQISVASVEDGAIVVRVAIADVDALVPKGSPVDMQAQRNTTTVYCAGKTYPMIHPRFSEDLTSLNEDEDRLAMVTEMVFGEKAHAGDVSDFRIYRAMVRSKVKLNYESTGAWLAGQGQAPLALLGKDDVVDSIQLQHKVAQSYKERRRRVGSLTLESMEARAKIEQGEVQVIEGQLVNPATELIENMMVACNGCTTKFLRAQGFPTFERVVRVPKRWDGIVEVAAEKGTKLPKEANSKALQQFLEAQHKEDPLHFPDLCLEVLKLLGRGEYVAELPDQPPVGHFGLAVREYSHSTAPNRRYPDVITQRLLKAALAGDACPYNVHQLEALARHCSLQESNSKKVERKTQKCAAAAMLRPRIGEYFMVVVSGQNDASTWVRLLDMPVEGKLSCYARLGQVLQVRLVSVNVEKGFIDFEPSDAD